MVLSLGLGFDVAVSPCTALEVDCFALGRLLGVTVPERGVEAVEVPPSLLTCEVGWPVGRDRLVVIRREEDKPGELEERGVRELAACTIGWGFGTHSNGLRLIRGLEGICTMTFDVFDADWSFVPVDWEDADDRAVDGGCLGEIVGWREDACGRIGSAAGRVAIDVAGSFRKAGREPRDRSYRRAIFCLRARRRFFHSLV